MEKAGRRKYEQRPPTGRQMAVVYTLRVDVTVPIEDGAPSYSAAEVVNRVDAALRHVPGDATVQLLEYSTVDE